MVLTMKQIVSNPPLKWWQGMLAITALVLLLSGAQFFAALISYMAGGGAAYTAASVSYWLFGGVVAFLFIRAFIMKYQYSVEGLSFNIERLYGRMKPRLAVSIITRKIVDIDTVKAIAEKYPNLQHYTSYTKKHCDIEVKCLVYDAGGGYKMIRFQPDEELESELKHYIKNGK